MLLKNKAFHQVYRSPEGDGGGGGSIDPNSPEVKAIIEAAVANATSGLKTKNDELIAEKRKLQELTSQFDGLDMTTLKSYVDRLKNDEEAKLIAEGKIDDVINRRTDRMREAFQGKIDEAKTEAQKAKEERDALLDEFNHAKMRAAVRDAALADGVQTSAIDDIVYRAHNVFTFKDGKLVAIDPATNDVRIGADGKTPYSPNDFVADLRKQAPHFWPSSGSGGFSGGRGSGVNAVEDAKRLLGSPGGFEAYRKMRAKEKTGK